MQVELELTDESYELFRKYDDKYYSTSIILVYSVTDVRKADLIFSKLGNPDPRVYEDSEDHYFSISVPNPGIDDIFLVKGKLIELLISE